MEQTQEQVLKAVADLRETYDANMKRVESEQKERDEKVNARIDELLAKMHRPVQSNPEDDKAEYHKAFAEYVRRGERAGDAVLKTLSTTNADGGYSIPEVLNRQIYSLQRDFGVMRQLARVISVQNEDYRELVNIHGATASWVAETTARGNTNTPQMAELTPSMGEIYAAPLATQKILDDAGFDVESWLAMEVAEGFALAEEAAFVSGNGVNRPKGFLAGNVVTSADSARSFGDIQYVATGADGGFTTNVQTQANCLFDLVYSLKAAHRQGASWMAPKAAYLAIRKFRDSQNGFLWQPGLQAGQPQTILAYPAYENELMPAIASNSYSVAFGNWQRAYTVVDRIGIRTLRDPFTQKPYVVFYTTKRVGGFLKDSEAVKALKFYTS